MSNVKRISMSGEVPFDLVEHEGLRRKLADLNTPTFGVRITYGRQTRLLPNSRGGRTAMYAFQLVGREAVNIAWLQSFANQVREVGGTVASADVYDVEAEERIQIRL